MARELWIWITLFVVCPLSAENRVLVETPAGTKHEMALVPEGEFVMGLDGGWQEDDGMYSQVLPMHSVYLDSFYIDIYEVTQAQYHACVASGACGEPRDTNTSFTFSLCNWGKVGWEDHPMTCVTWYQAQDYCGWAGLRLPSEAEWEKAARGTDGRVYPWGNVFDGTRANYGPENFTTVSVGRFHRGVSPYGIFNMAGNVDEWTSDQVVKGAGVGSGWENLFSAHRWVFERPERYTPFRGFRCAIERIDKDQTVVQQDSWGRVKGR